MISPDFGTAVSADLQTLQSFLGLNPEARDLYTTYMIARFYFLSGDTEGLAAFIEKSSSVAPSWLTLLMKYRLHIRSGTSHPAEEESLRVLRAVDDSSWPAEIQMVLGMYFEETGRLAEAVEAYSKSARLFATLALTEKSLMADYNALIAQTQLHPEKRYLVAYNSFVVKSQEAGFDSLAGVALSNFSREYQLLGLFEMALVKADEAIDLLKRRHYGTRHYYLAVAQALDLLIHLKRHERAQKLYEELLSSSSREIAEVVKVLQRYCPRTDRDPDAIQTEVLPSPWAERFLQTGNSAEVVLRSDLENQMIDLLVEKPRSLAELATLLHGDKIDPYSAVARTKQAIYRLRKKTPNLIVLRKGRYEIID